MRLCPNGRFALKFFLNSFLIQLTVLILIYLPFIGDFLLNKWIFISIIYYILTNIFIYSKRKSYIFRYSIAWRSVLLGYVFSVGVLIAFLLENSLKPFGFYLCALSFFHFSEYIIISIVNPRTLHLSSFHLNHSFAYNVAAIASWIEFFIEYYLFENIKLFHLLTFFGVCLCIGGEVIRKLAMITAGKNFNHLIQAQRHDGHHLVKSGVYSICRHPSYLGWFLWSIGTQLILINPISLIGYIITSWLFFKDRIEMEEILLIEFFGDEYIDYQKKVFTGLPFIKGYEK